MCTCNFSIIEKSIANKLTVIKSVLLYCNICIVISSVCINSISISNVCSKCNVSVNVRKTLVL